LDCAVRAPGHNPITATVLERRVTRITHVTRRSNLAVKRLKATQWWTAAGHLQMYSPTIDFDRHPQELLHET
jgi:hypothetical protein